MNAESQTQIKLMILYMLNRVNFQLSDSQILGYFKNDGVEEADLRMLLGEMASNSLVEVEKRPDKNLLGITKEGEETLGYFESKISEKDRSDIESFLESRRIDLRKENTSLADYRETENNQYEVRLEVREGRKRLIDLRISADNEKMAEHMCEKWQDSSSEIYNFVVHRLLE